MLGHGLSCSVPAIASHPWRLTQGTMMILFFEMTTVPHARFSDFVPKVIDYFYLLEPRMESCRARESGASFSASAWSEVMPHSNDKSRRLAPCYKRSHGMILHSLSTRGKRITTSNDILGNVHTIPMHNKNQPLRIRLSKRTEIRTSSGTERWERQRSRVPAARQPQIPRCRCRFCGDATSTQSLSMPHPKP